MNLALLILPFLIVPFLISSTYIDSTLLIKKTAAFILFLIPSLFFLKSQKPNNRTLLKYSYQYVIVFIGFICINLFVSTNYIESIGVFLNLLGWIAVYMLFSYYGSTKLIKYIIYTTIFISAILSLLLFNDVFGLIDLYIPTAGKLSATFGYKNFYAQYLCFALPASFIGFFIVKEHRNKFFMLIVFIIILLALIFTRTRAAWLGSFIPIFIFIISYRKFIYKQLKIFLNNKVYQFFLVLSSILFITIIFKPIDIKKGIWIGDKSSFLDTVLTIKDLNKKDLWGYRLEMYNTTLNMIKDNPVFGVGFGNWKILYPSYASNKHLTDSDPYKIVMRPHNDLLWLIAEIGLLGFVFCVFFSYQHFKILVQKIRSTKSSNDRLIYSFILLSLSAIFIESMFDFPSERVIPNLFFWSMLGFISSDENSKNYRNIIPVSIFLLLLSTVIFSFFNLKAHLHTQLISNKIKDRDYNKVLYHSMMAKNNFRNTNYLGIPIDYYQGIAFFNKHRYQEALTHFNKALHLYPYHLGSMDYIYRIYLYQNNIKEAEKAVENISIKYPNIKKPKIDLLNYLKNKVED